VLCLLRSNKGDERNGGIVMIVQKDFLGKLKDFGLNSYEAKLWTALLSRGIATAGELSDIANVPRSRSYDVLESLERKGFVVMKLGKPIKYIAVPPAEVVDRVKKSIHEDAERQEKVIEKLKESEVLTELNNLHDQGIKMVDPVDLTGAVRGRQNLYHHLSSRIKNAQKTICISTTAQGLVRKADALKGVLQKAKAKGVSIKILTSGKDKGSDAAMKKLAGLAKIKQVANVPARFCVFDGNQVTFMVLDDNTHPNYDFGVWAAAEGFAKNFENTFNLLWDKK